MNEVLRYYVIFLQIVVVDGYVWSTSSFLRVPGQAVHVDYFKDIQLYKSYGYSTDLQDSNHPFFVGQVVCLLSHTAYTKIKGKMNTVVGFIVAYSSKTAKRIRAVMEVSSFYCSKRWIVRTP